jgi:hypothetical protein
MSITFIVSQNKNNNLNKFFMNIVGKPLTTRLVKDLLVGDIGYVIPANFLWLKRNDDDTAMVYMNPLTHCFRTAETGCDLKITRDGQGQTDFDFNLSTLSTIFVVHDSEPTDKDYIKGDLTECELYTPEKYYHRIPFEALTYIMNNAQASAEGSIDHEKVKELELIISVHLSRLGVYALTRSFNENAESYFDIKDDLNQIDEKGCFPDGTMIYSWKSTKRLYDESGPIYRNAILKQIKKATQEQITDLREQAVECEDYELLDGIARVLQLS